MEGLKYFRLTLVGDYSRDVDKSWHFGPLKKIRQLNTFIVESYFDYVTDQGDPFVYRRIGATGVEIIVPKRCPPHRRW